MSDIADAVFGGQLLGHVIAGEELTTAVLTDAAMTADLAAHMVVDDDISSVEHQILQAKVAGATYAGGHYDPGDINSDHYSAQDDSILSSHLLG
jgi:hypothetical protein